VALSGSVELARRELAHDPTIDITTTGRMSGQPRRIEIWMLDVDGRFFITGTVRPTTRDWLANLRGHPRCAVHLKQLAHVDLLGVAQEVIDPELRRAVLGHESAAWYRSQQPLDQLVADAPMVEITFLD
jgi:deazaflavin-dependent oxidoreductase (nitroreductase family)